MDKNISSPHIVCANKTVWPAIIFGIIALVILVGIAFSNSTDTNNKAWSFVMVLIFSLLWLGIIYWLCTTGNHALGWVLLLLPILLFILWPISYWLASATTPKECVINGPSLSYS